MKVTPVVVCGSIAIDRIMHFSGNYHSLIDADKLDVLSLSVLVDGLSVVEGGTGGNISYNLAKLGQGVSLMDCVGPDGKEYVKRLTQMGVDTTAVRATDLPTSSFQVLTDSGGNQVGGFYPGAMAEGDQLNLSRWTKKDTNIFVCLSPHDPTAMRHQVEECLKNRISFMYDPGQQVNMLPINDLKRGIETAQIVIVNDYEFSLLKSRTGLSESILRQQVPVLIITHGKNGSSIYEGPATLKVGVATPETYIDPTGAGDAYRAGFLYGFLRQWELRQCGQLGAVVASFALEHHGPQAEYTQAAVKKRYQQVFNESLEL